MFSLINKKKLVTYSLTKSPWVGHLNSGSCNGCDIEALALFCPRYDVERFGILLEGDPRHCDILLVTGPVTNQTLPRLKRIYEQIPEPKFVIALGNCTSTGGVFLGTWNTLDGVDKVIPVDLYIPGCPPRPEAIVDGVIKLIQKLRHESSSKGEEIKE